MIGGDLIVVSSADEGYILPLTVMVRSLLENLAGGTRVDLYIIQDNVSPTSRDRAEDSWKPFPVRSHWITPEKPIIDGNTQGFTGPPATYFRLLVGEILPPEASKAVYLDADIVVLGDLSELWNMEMNGKLALAVPDAYAKSFHLGRMSRMAFKENVRFTSQSSYFNAGVLLIDVEGWRREAVGERALRFIKDYGENLAFRDQDALNCALQGRWGHLSPTWNFHELPDCLFLWNSYLYHLEDIQEAISKPKVVHFTSHAKPWMKRCAHVSAGEFYAYLSQTRWSERKIPDQSGMARLVRKFLILPHSRLNRWVWRKEVSAGRFRAALLLLGTHPWMLLTYPLWQVLVWLYFLLFMPIDRRCLIPGRR